MLIWARLLLLPGVLLQDEYTLVFDRFEVVQFSHDYFRSVRSHNFKYNRTYTAVNLTFDLIKDVPSSNGELVAEVQAYKFYSNEYRLFPLRFNYDMCASINSNDYGLSRLFKCGNFTKCPFKKSILTACNFAPDGLKFPPLIPGGAYKLDLKLFYLHKEIVFFQSLGSIKYPSCPGCPVE